MKNGWCKKIICFLVLAIMAISTMGTGVFATEGAEGGEGGDQQVDVNKIISVTPVRGHQRIMVKWEVSDEADADGFIVDRYSYNTGKWTKEYCVVDMDEGQKSETDGQLSFQIEDKDVGDGMIDSAKVAYRGGVFKYRITPYKD
ncbi:MAG: hypothetical protein Q4D99_05800, partial [Bacillota bacterium]|nr:hypothetical protein [Bacillota bacterium]